MIKFWLSCFALALKTTREVLGLVKKIDLFMKLVAPFIAFAAAWWWFGTLGWPGVIIAGLYISIGVMTYLYQLLRAPYTKATEWHGQLDLQRQLIEGQTEEIQQLKTPPLPVRHADGIYQHDLQVAKIVGLKLDLANDWAEATRVEYGPEFNDTRPFEIGDWEFGHLDYASHQETPGSPVVLTGHDCDLKLNGRRKGPTCRFV
ncbi:MAG: hypothetical protein EOP17_03250 [Rhizobiaceae bacterium]|nr:MAG: hypothetical protein EOP17_03250 [Rhizobiaceae bacterium]